VQSPKEQPGPLRWGGHGFVLATGRLPRRISLALRSAGASQDGLELAAERSSERGRFWAMGGRGIGSAPAAGGRLGVSIFVRCRERRLAPSGIAVAPGRTAGAYKKLVVWEERFFAGAVMRLRRGWGDHSRRSDAAHSLPTSGRARRAARRFVESSEERRLARWWNARRTRFR